MDSTTPVATATQTIPAVAAAASRYHSPGARQEEGNDEAAEHPELQRSAVLDVGEVDAAVVQHHDLVDHRQLQVRVRIVDGDARVLREEHDEQGDGGEDRTAAHAREARRMPRSGSPQSEMLPRTRAIAASPRRRAGSASEENHASRLAPMPSKAEPVSSAAVMVKNRRARGAPRRARGPRRRREGKPRPPTEGAGEPAAQPTARRHGTRAEDPPRGAAVDGRLPEELHDVVPGLQQGLTPSARDDGLDPVDDPRQERGKGQGYADLDYGRKGVLIADPAASPHRATPASRPGGPSGSPRCTGRTAAACRAAAIAAATGASDPGEHGAEDAFGEEIGRVAREVGPGRKASGDRRPVATRGQGDAEHADQGLRKGGRGVLHARDRAGCSRNPRCRRGGPPAPRLERRPQDREHRREGASTPATIVTWVNPVRVRSRNAAVADGSVPGQGAGEGSQQGDGNGTENADSRRTPRRGRGAGRSLQAPASRAAAAAGVRGSPRKKMPNALVKHAAARPADQREGCHDDSRRRGCRRGPPDAALKAPRKTRNSLTNPFSGGRPQMATAPTRNAAPGERHASASVRPAGRSPACRPRARPSRRRGTGDP